MTSPSFTDTMLHDTLFLDDIVLSHANKAPDKLALTFNDKNITYTELSASVALLAQQLLRSGIAPGDFVTVLLPSSELITTALLAIIRIGAIYAPLDPEHPESQLIARYHAINAKCTITTSKLQERFNGWAPITIAIDAKAPEINNALPLPTRDINQPACIFFTSGTTGEAKGVLGSARAMRDSILGPAQDLHFTHTDTLNSIARYAWSISMLELLAPLVVGGTSLILERQHALDLTWLKKQAEACTAFHCPPALLRSLANFIEQNYSEAEYLSYVRLAWYGGDAFSPENITQLHTVFPNALVGTAYGCTEIFGLSHIHYYQRHAAINKVLIGKPVTGISQRIHDDNAQEAGVHQEGEILLGGNRIALEYWRNPELNAEKFTVIDGVRHFKTGDYACPDQTGA